MLRCISGQLGHACSYEVSIYLTALQGSSATCKSPLSNRSPLAEQPQQVGCRLGLLPDLACLGAPAPFWPSDTHAREGQSS